MKVGSSNIWEPDLGSLDHTGPGLGQGGTSWTLPGYVAVSSEYGSEVSLSKSLRLSMRI